jgi:hypothetical protein
MSGGSWTAIWLLPGNRVYSSVALKSMLDGVMPPDLTQGAFRVLASCSGT